MLARENGNDHVSQPGRRALAPRVLETDAIDDCDDVDADRWDADLEDQSSRGEIRLGQIVQRRTKSSERTVDAGSILFARLHPNIEIFGRTDQAMGRQRMTADDQILNAVGVECGQQIAEVGVHRGRRGSRRSTVSSVPRQP